MESFLLALFAAYVIQSLMAYLQMAHFKKIVRELRAKGIVGIGAKKRKLMAGNIVILVSDQSGDIVEAWTMRGVSVFARFKKIENIRGLSLHELRKQTLNEKDPALVDALNQLEAQLI
ncbi:glucitol operon activator [Lucifera butyrica]|uniref:Glucitol operon activator n=1 Tax=Lucifera butyrica TaxID=1351585 RepID=A0A498R8T7_9FIRM|nr:transcriptional regulator GutM [Lucifera butyrica]VBB07340.1 glucitol operon activator [Lucifera butyrica]